MSHRNAELLFDRYALPLMRARHDVLDVGPGAKFRRSRIRRLAAEIGCSYHFCDLGNYGRGEPEFIEQAGEYHVATSERFDFIVANQVFEHVRKPWLLVMELARLLADNGMLVIVAPVNLIVHRHPVDCWRILADGMRVLLEEAGLKVVVVTSESLDEDDAETFRAWHGRPIDTIGIGSK